MLGAEIARHVRLADMNLDVPVSDELGIEVVANGLPLARAPDATIGVLAHFSPRTPTRAQTSSPVPPCRPQPSASGIKRRQELERARRCRLVVVGLEVGGRFGAELV